jgi:hypothetical protein
MKKFVGSTHDGSNCAFQYPWGIGGRFRSAPQNPAATHKRDVLTEVMMGIWSPRTDYSEYVPFGNWMDATHLLPVIAYLYKIPMLVLFDNHGFDGSCVFYTYIYFTMKLFPL